MQSNRFDIHARRIDNIPEEDSNYGVLFVKRDCEMTVEASEIVTAIGIAKNYLDDGYIITGVYQRNVPSCIADI